MAVSKQTVIFEFDTNTGEVLRATNQLEKSFEEVAEAAQGAAEATSEIGDSAEAASKEVKDVGKESKKSESALKKAGKTGAQGFKILGTAVKATGIGLIVAAVAKLLEKLTENKAIAESLEVAFAALGVVLNTIVDALTPVADFLFKAFTEPQAAVETLRTRLTELGDYLGTLLATAFNPIQKGLLNLKRGFLEAAIGAKEFFGGDATELKKSIKEVDDQLADLTKQQEENKDALAAPFEAAQEAVQTYINRTKDAVKASNDLTQRQQELRDAERDLAVETAQQAANIEELKRQRDDERLSIEERLRLSEEAAAIDQRIADENVRIQEEKARLLREEIELQGETQERLQALADAEIAAADARAASAGVQTELMTNIYSLNQEALDLELEVAALRREFVAENLEGIEAERQAVEDQLTDRIATIERLKVSEEEKTALILEATASRDAQLEALEAAHQAELDAIANEAAEKEAARQKEADDKAQAQRDKELADAEALAAARIDVAKQTLGALAALNDAFAGDSEVEQKKAFERSKKIQSAQALISTYESAVQAFKSLAGIPVVGPALGTAASVAAIASGLAQVKSIQSQTLGGGATAPAPAPAPALSAAATEATQAPSAPTLDLSFLGDIATTPQPQQAYVISENVTTAQQANKKIQDQAAL
jgi:hypothetical protein